MDTKLVFELLGRDKASPVFDQFGRRVDQTRGKVSTLGTATRNLGPILAGLGIGKVIADSVKLEATYSKTMAQVAVATDAPQASLQRLDDLAMKMGADTVFSAQDAASAMLELAKGGLTPAEIRAGSLANTLTLASAGSLELGDAANTVVQAMGAFRLGSDETGAAVAALAGAANASSADVSDITQALAQAGTSAHSAGLSIQDTTAYLAMFADQGIKGSDAGTSLRTMLSRLVPQTARAQEAMAGLGLTYVDGNGKLVDAEEIASRTQEAFKGLSDEQRIAAVNAIFGADAQRAVNAITSEGEEGLKKYKEATSDLTQAQKLADAANSGTAGAMEKLSGAYETAKIQIGKGLAPVVQDLADKASELIEDGDFERWASDAGEAVAGFVETATPVAQSVLPALGDAAKIVAGAAKDIAPAVKTIADAFNSLPPAVQSALVLGTAGVAVGNKITGGLPVVLPGGRDKGGGSPESKGKPGKRGGGKGGRGLGAVPVVGAAILATLGPINAALDSLGDGSANVDRLTQSFTKAGKATDVTRHIIDQAFADGSVGRHAADLGFNVDKIAGSLSKAGTSGVEYRNTLSQIDTRMQNLIKAGDVGSEFFALADMREQLTEVGAATDRASDKASEGRGRQKAFAAALGTTGDKASDTKHILDALGRTNAKPKVSLKDNASPQLKAIQAARDRLRDKTITMTVRRRELIERARLSDRGNEARAGDRKAAGGAIIGAGSRTSDDIPIWGSNGEHMLTAADVDALGGHTGVYALRRALHSAANGPTAGGARPSAPGLSGPALSEASLARAFAAALSGATFRLDNGNLRLSTKRA